VKIKRLRIFDFDDTLVKTRSFVYVKNGNKTKKLTPGEYAIYEEKPGDEFDYSDFEFVKNPKEIKQMTKVLKAILSKSGGSINILTARSNYKPIRKYLKDINIDISRIYVIALASNDPADKVNWIKNKIENESYNDIFYVDDSLKNINAAKEMLSKTKVKWRVQHVKY
tara:strand:- start:1917 stop:2420 length:504 start_codon:yes stop_codon:yes gene_type:complete